MPYTITLTNGNILTTISDGTTNTDYSMTLIGQNFVGYGEIQDNNFIRLLENGSNNTAPGNALVGQLWFDSGNTILKVNTATGFKSISSVTSSSVAPASPIAGDLWFNTGTQQLEVWTGATWLVVGPPNPSGTGASPVILTDEFGGEHQIIEFTIDGNIVGIVSQDNSFAPVPGVDGFSIVYPGITLSTLVNSQLPIFTGNLSGTATSATVAANATALNGLTANSFMRTDQDTSTTGQVRIVNNNGLSIGATNQFSASVGTSSTVNLYNNASNGNLHIGVNKGGANTAVVLVDGSTGNVLLTGNLIVQGTTTTVNSNTLSTNDLIIYVANNASTSSLANGGGLEVGPVATPYAKLTFNSVANSWAMSIPLTVNGGISSTTVSATGNITSGNITSGNILASGILNTAALTVSGLTTLTGVATAPTAANGTSNTQIATTAFVQNQLVNIAGGPGTVVQTQFTQSSAGQTFTGPTAAVALSLTFTPRYANSRILIQMVCPALVNGEGTLGACMQIARGSTVLSTTMMGAGGNGVTLDADSALPSGQSMYSQAYDAPGTTSPVTYNMLVRVLQDEPNSPDSEYYMVYIGDAVISQWDSVNLGYPVCNYSILIQEIKQ